MPLITPEEKVQLLKNLLCDPDDWISQEILTIVAQEAEKQKARSEASLPKATTSNRFDTEDLK